MIKRGTILIVDDEPDVREGLEEYLGAQGYSTTSGSGSAT